MRWLLLVMLVACGGTPSAGGGDDAPASDARRDDGGGGGTSDAPPGVRGVFDPAVTEILIEIDYEQGNEPYTGAMLGGGDTFDLSATNIDRLFAGTKQLTLPRTTATMQNIGAVADNELTVNDLVALAAMHRGQPDSATRKTFYLLFVGGYFADANGPNPNVLGVSLGGTGVIAMFKDVIRGTSVLGLPNVVRYVEQSTLIHELGHAVGLVDNGIAMAGAHKDAAHGAHCDDDRCVMYWLNEGANDAAAYVQQNVLTNNTIIFDAACLADVDALTGGP